MYATSTLACTLFQKYYNSFAYPCQMAYLFSPLFGQVSTLCISRYGQAGWGSLGRAECQSNAACVVRWPLDCPRHCNPKLPSSHERGAPQQMPAKQAPYIRHHSTHKHILYVLGVKTERPVLRDSIILH